MGAENGLSLKDIKYVLNELKYPSELSKTIRFPNIIEGNLNTHPSYLYIINNALIREIYVPYKKGGLMLLLNRNIDINELFDEVIISTKNFAKERNEIPLYFKAGTRIGNYIDGKDIRIRKEPDNDFDKYALFDIEKIVSLESKDKAKNTEHLKKSIKEHEEIAKLIDASYMAAVDAAKKSENAVAEALGI